MDSATEKLELGLQRLARADADPDMLALALQSIHGALEDAFRNRLAADPSFPDEQRGAVVDPRQVQWRDLLDYMQLYGDLPATAREQIWRMNAARTKVAHGGRTTLDRAEVQRYAALAQSLLGYTPPKPPPATPPKATKTEKPEPKPTRTRAEAPAADIPRAVRVEGTAPPPSRSRAGWLVVLLALGLLLSLAGFVVLRGAAQARREAPTAPLPSDVAAEAATPEPEAAAAAPTPAPRFALVAAAEGLNLRAGPSETAQIVAVLPDGSRVAIIGGPVSADGREWWNIEADGQRGWCAGEFVRFES